MSVLHVDFENNLMPYGRPMVIFDIDGTIADNRHRLHYILHDDPSKKDWDAYDAAWEKDTYIPAMGDLFKALMKSPEFYAMLLTGRNERGRANTLAWLRQHGINLSHPSQLIMRSLKDYRDAGTMKLDYLKKRNILPEHVLTLFDDNNHVVAALRAEGYHVCHVADDYTTAVHEGGPGETLLTPEDSNVERISG